MLDKIEEVANKHGKYSPQAYLMIFETLEWLHERGLIERHLTGQELSLSMFTYSLYRYGLLSKMVWEEGGITSSEDIGNMIYHLIDAQLMNKQESDSQSDFNKVLTTKDFDDVPLFVMQGKKKYDLRIEFDLPTKLRI